MSSGIKRYSLAIAFTATAKAALIAQECVTKFDLRGS